MRGAGTAQERGPNALLRLMRSLKDRTQGLILLTATPMQVHPVEVWDLLSLLGLPREWSQQAFLSFFDEIGKENPSHEAMDRLAGLFRAVESTYGAVDVADVQGAGIASRLRAKKVLEALRDPASVPRRQFEADQRQAAIRLMRRNTPVSRLISRHTRDLLRQYHRAGKLSTRIANREVQDEFIPLSPDERTIYDAVEHYIATTYNQAITRGASGQERSAIGFVMTIYRRRLASSFHALERTLTAHLAAIGERGETGALFSGLAEDIDEDETEAPEEDEAEALTRQALALEERGDIEQLLAMIRRLPPDTKSGRLQKEITRLRDAGYGQVTVFSQFTDTMDFLRAELSRDGALQIMCFSGRGGEVQTHDGSWRVISRDDVKRRFRDGQADVLLCTDAAAEGLNFQFCGALINYDSPWNPMRVEQRIGRIDRLGQRFDRIRIVNLHYEHTVEADVYLALRRRIGLFQRVVGGLQPILARMPGIIGARVLGGQGESAVEAIERAVDAIDGGFDLDAVTVSDLELPNQAPAPLTMDDLDMVLADPKLRPPDVSARPLGSREYAVQMPGRDEVRTTTDARYYEEHAESCELWSPGGAAFPELSEMPDDALPFGSLRQLLASRTR